MRSVIAVCALLFSLSALSVDKLEKGSKQQEQKSEQSKPTTENYKNVPEHSSVRDITITVSPTFAAGNESGDKGENKKDVSNWEALTGISTAMLAVITGLLAYFTYWLWTSTSNLVRESKDTARKELRAYVALYKVEFLPESYATPSGQNLLTGSLSDDLSVTVKNYGRTPSFDTSIRCRSTTSEPNNLELLEVGNHPGVGRQMFHPNQDFRVTIKETNSPRHNKKGWVWGHFVYRDIFGQGGEPIFSTLITPKDCSHQKRLTTMSRGHLKQRNWLSLALRFRKPACLPNSGLFDFRESSI